MTRVVLTVQLERRAGDEWKAISTDMFVGDSLRGLVGDDGLRVVQRLVAKKAKEEGRQ